MINFAKFATNEIKDAQILRHDGGPHILGLWINKWRRTWTERYTRKCVEDIVESSNKEDRLELERIFYKKFMRRLDLRKINERAEIARCIMDFNGLPGVVRFNSARVALQSLLKEFVEFENIEIAKPGFLNIYFHISFWKKYLSGIIKLKSRYGINKIIKENANWYA